MDELAGSNVAWAGHTSVHPLGLIALVVASIAILMVRRRYAVLPILFMACFVSSAQRIVIGAVDFDFLRLLVVVGWARLLLHGETRAFIWKPIDLVMILWAISGALIFTAKMGTTGALVNRLGWSFDILGMYFLFRCLVRDWDDLRTIAVGVSVLAFPVLLAFLVEFTTTRNPFAFFGGVPEVTMTRQGKLRCQGPYSHPIMAGSFWAALIPLIAVQWWRRGNVRYLAVAATVAAGLIVLLARSSGPAAAVIFGAAAAAAYGLRYHMREFRWLALAGVIGLHLVMKAPVWHLVTRVDLTGGSTGWHRFMLYDQFINRVDEWWLLGTTSTSHWGRGLRDVTSQYILEAVRGGGLTLVLFLIVLALAYRNVGRLWRMQERAGAKAQEYMAWALGVSLFVHSVSFLSVSYFGQIIVIWYLLLATITSLTASGERASMPVHTQAVAGRRRRRPIVAPAGPVLRGAGKT